MTGLEALLYPPGECPVHAGRPVVAYEPLWRQAAKVANFGVSYGTSIISDAAIQRWLRMYQGIAWAPYYLLAGVV